MSELKFTEDHEWIRLEEDGAATVGITDYAQEQLGDVVYVELPEVGRELGKDDEAAVVESVKAASDIYCPVSGDIVEVNEALNDTPEIINDDPYGDGWLFTLHPTEAGEVESLMSAEAYAEIAEEELPG